jgi:ferric enterobactin receptor
MRVFILLFLVSLYVTAQNKNLIKGRITRTDNNEPVAGASISLTEIEIGTFSDSAGYYEFKIPKGSFLFKISHESYFKKYLRVESKNGLVQDFTLDEKVNDLDELKVSASSSEQNVKRLGTGVNTLNARALKKLPTLLGEVDIIKSLFTLPGVTTVGEGASGFNVRGGNIDQNLVLIDESPVFNSSHLLGFFSVFNPDAFRDFSFYRGGVPAQYGGRISSVLNVSMKDANANKFSMSGGLGTVASRIFIETPIIPDKLSFYVAGRISYVDQMINVFNIKKLEGSKASFYDVNSKLEYKPTKKDRISISIFHGNDNFKLAKDTISALDESIESLYSWSSTNGTVAWSHYFGPKFSIKSYGLYSKYDVSISNTDSLTAFKMNNWIDYRSFKTLAYYTPNKNNEIEIGVQVNSYLINPGILTKSSPSSNKNPVSLRPENGTESAVFINDKISINKKFDLSLGLRYVLYQNRGQNTVYRYQDGKPRNKLTRVDSTNYNAGEIINTYGSLEPRLFLNWTIDKTSSIKASANRIRQFMQMMSATTAALPSDQWKLSDTYIKPQLADQISLGYFKNLKGKSLESSIEVFYKKLDNVIDYKEGEKLFLNPNLETVVLQGKGYAYGAELYFKKNLGIFTGWLSYTYSQSRIKIKGDTDEETINNGEYFPPIFNRPHSFNAIGSYQANKIVSFSGNANFTSGRAITYPASKFFLSGATLPFYNSRNQSQIPYYLRFDVSMNIETHPYRTKGYRGTWNFSLYNLFGRRNAYSVFFRSQTPTNIYNTTVKIYKLSVLGSIIPSLTYNFKI